MISQPVSSTIPYYPLPSGTWRTPNLTIPWCCLPTSSSVCLVFFPLSLMVLSRPDELETWPYHCSLGLFTIVRRSSCGSIACWILAQTSSLVAWPLYEMRSILEVAPRFDGLYSSLELCCDGSQNDWLKRQPLIIKSTTLPLTLSADKLFLSIHNPLTVGFLESVSKVSFSPTTAGLRLLIKRFSSSKLAFRPRIV